MQFPRCASFPPTLKLLLFLLFARHRSALNFKRVDIVTKKKLFGAEVELTKAAKLSFFCLDDTCVAPEFADKEGLKLNHCGTIITGTVGHAISNLMTNLVHFSDFNNTIHNICPRVTIINGWNLSDKCCTDLEVGVNPMCNHTKVRMIAC